jgi:pimeloyl-ACP methyl ester carboxylesterase
VKLVRLSVGAVFPKLVWVICLIFIAPVPALQAGDMTVPQIKQMQVNGINLTYQDQGQGTPVVFVPGALSDYRVWDAERVAVASRYRFIALTQRYFGTGPWPDSGAKFSVATHADDLAAFIKGLHVGPVVLVGWSYSGPIVLLVAVQHPELARGMFIYEPGSLSYVTDGPDLKLATDDRKAMNAPGMAASKAGDNAQAARLILAGVNNQSDAFDSAPEAIRTMWLENDRTLPLGFAAPSPPKVTCQQLGKIKVPVTIARGEQTRPFYRIAAEAAARCIPGAKLVVLPKDRHLAPVQDPVLVSNELMKFLSAW